MKLDRYAIDYLDKVGFKAPTGEWCRASDVVLLEKKLATACKHVEFLERTIDELGFPIPTFVAVEK